MTDHSTGAVNTYRLGEARAREQIRELREQIGSQREQIEHLRRVYAAAVTRAEQAQENLRRVTAERDSIERDRIGLAVRLDDLAEMLEAVPDVFVDLLADALAELQDRAAHR